MQYQHLCNGVEANDWEQWKQCVILQYSFRVMLSVFIYEREVSVIAAVGPVFAFCEAKRSNGPLRAAVI
jgi:hypothetical protein